MNSKQPTNGPEHTAVRVALWRALHVEIDPKPHVFSDVIGAQIVGESDWSSRLVFRCILPKKQILKPFNKWLYYRQVQFLR